MTSEFKTGIRAEMDRCLPFPWAFMDWFTGQPMLEPGEKVQQQDPLFLFGRDLAILGAMTTPSVLALSQLPLGLASAEPENAPHPTHSSPEIKWRIAAFGVRAINLLLQKFPVFRQRNDS